MVALPVPVTGGSIDELRLLVNLPDDGMWTLFVAWLAACVRPRGPYPILVVGGEQGSAKSSLCRFGRAIIDPNVAPLRRPPKDDRDLMITATNGWILDFDNLSRLLPWVSDATYQHLSNLNADDAERIAFLQLCEAIVTSQDGSPEPLQSGTRLAADSTLTSDSAAEMPEAPP